MIEVNDKSGGGCLFLSPLFSSGAVLQRERPLKIFGGGADPGRGIRVDLGGCTASGKAGADGTWEVVLPPLPAGGPHELTVAGCGARLVREGVHIGEVWLCSGQSNMQFTMADWQRRNRRGLPPGSDSIRFFLVREAVSSEPAEEVRGQWRRCTGADLEQCSAVAYFFARRLHEQTGIAVGLIVSALWDTEIASWTPGRSASGLRRGSPLSFRPAVYTDPGPASLAPAQPDFDDSCWPVMDLPGLWQLQGHRHSGSVWFRREIILPPGMERRKLLLEPGIPDDHDIAFFNGIEVGRTGPEVPDSYVVPRRYPVPPGAARPGRNVVALRIFDACSLGGVSGPAGGMRLSCAGDPGWSLPLAGEWRSHCEHVFPWLWSQSPGPGLLYNAMIHPLRKFALRGAIWYQGESDRIRASQYRNLLVDMVRAWREAWKIEFPFFIVQLPGFLFDEPVNGGSLWAELREAQYLAARDLGSAALVSAVDLGEALDIHPKHKEAVGERLAAMALARVHGSEEEACGPVPEGVEIDGGRIRIRFLHASGLRARGALEGFAVAGKDRNFLKAEAEIQGSTIVVWHPEVTAPEAARYGWSDHSPSGLENGAGLPAVPFRTDSFPVLSEAVQDPAFG